MLIKLFFPPNSHQHDAKNQVEVNQTAIDEELELCFPIDQRLFLCVGSGVTMTGAGLGS